MRRALPALMAVLWLAAFEEGYAASSAVHEAPQVETGDLTLHVEKVLEGWEGLEAHPAASAEIILRAMEKREGPIEAVTGIEGTALFRGLASGRHQAVAIPSEDDQKRGFVQTVREFHLQKSFLDPDLKRQVFGAIRMRLDRQDTSIAAPTATDLPPESRSTAYDDPAVWEGWTGTGAQTIAFTNLKEVEPQEAKTEPPAAVVPEEHWTLWNGGRPRTVEMQAVDDAADSPRPDGAVRSAAMTASSRAFAAADPPGLATGSLISLPRAASSAEEPDGPPTRIVAAPPTQRPAAETRAPQEMFDEIRVLRHTGSETPTGETEGDKSFVIRPAAVATQDSGTTSPR